MARGHANANKSGNSRSKRLRNTKEAQEGPWKCNTCAFNNSGFLPYCELCEAHKEAPAGPFLQAERFESERPYRPFGGSSSSSADLVARPRMLEPNEGDGYDDTEDAGAELEWCCRMCSFSNVGVLPYCEMCEAARPSVASPIPERLPARVKQACAQERACPLCSYLNPSTRMACEICQAPLPISALPQTYAPPRQSVSPEAVPRPTKQVEAPVQDAADEDERRLLLSMGWQPEDDDEEGGLEEWEIDAAQENLIGRLQSAASHEGLRDRAQREFQAWKASADAAVAKSN